MRLSGVHELTLCALLLAGCRSEVLLAKDEPSPDADTAGTGGSAGSGVAGGSGASSTVPFGGSGGTSAGGTGTGSSGGSVVDAGLMPQPAVPDPGVGHFKVLVFTRTMEFVHDSIPTGVSMLKGMGAEFGDFDVVETKESTDFNDTNLAQYAAIVFMSTSGNVFTQDPGAAAQKAAFQKYMDHGGGFVGIHAAADTEKMWPWYVTLLGAYMDSHDSDGTAGVVLVDQSIRHPATLGLPASWARTDEWFHMSQPLAPEIKVLASLDEDTHRPVSWVHELSGGGRMFYTIQGHNRTCYAEPLFRQHILGALEWAAHRQDAKP
jgi:type 1 glutamine amidotransferase